MLKRLWNWIVNFGRKPYVHPAPTERLKREFVAYLEAKDRDIRDEIAARRARGIKLLNERRLMRDPDWRADDWTTY